MMKKHKSINKNSKRKHSGFTLVEMMLSVLIMLLFTTITASVMKTAILAYEKSVDCANGEMFVPSAISRLRIELTDARDLQKVTNIDYTNTDTGTVYGLDGYTIACGAFYTDAKTGAECIVFYGNNSEGSNLYVSKYGEVNPLVYTTDGLSLQISDITINENNVVFNSIAAIDKNNTVYSTVNEMTFVLQ